ncbi:hypothetical protein L249_3863 [Ophiocordyceps polyrhachis-furcata BCC 54312]|uniref:Uncharacterized protein n=1 Tax=Ophiocordyceps polyrhachis-furcata BCC 54312 TaxID=1330021 RepID=A0A367L648_9HYPO|nr:hypothetical protein L249_3863 [Ophiocordyceps polyrhachis-furcata BCC 54312]
MLAIPSSRSKLGTMAHRCLRQSNLAVSTVASRQYRTLHSRWSCRRANKYWYTESFSRGPLSWDRDDIARDAIRARFFATNVDRECDHRPRRKSFKEDKLAALCGILHSCRAISQSAAYSSSAQKPPQDDDSFIDPITNRRVSKVFSVAGTRSGDKPQVKPQYEKGTATEQPSGGYEDLDEYKDPILWKEPDGLPDPSPEDLSKNYDDLDEYGPVRWHEPDGMPEPSAEDKSKNYKDLRKYKDPYVVPDSLLSAYEKKQQTVTQKAEPLPGKVPVSSGEPAKDNKDLGDYGPTYWREPDGLMEPSAEDLSKNYQDLEKYDAQYDATESTSQPSAGISGDAEQCDNKSCATTRPSQASKKCRSLPKHVTDGLGVSGDVENKPSNSKYQDAYNEPGAEPLIWTGLDKGAGPCQPKKADDMMRRACERRFQRADLKKGVDVEASSMEAKSKDGLTGKYMWDFPEDFSTSWSTANSWSKSTLYPDNGDQVSAAVADLGRDEAEPSSMDESFPSESSSEVPQLQPSLDRGRDRRKVMSRLERKRLEKDPYSKEPQGLETSYSEECGGRLGRPRVRFHEVKAATAAADGAKRMASYKILAYDEDRNSVDVTETTWPATQMTASFSPAEVLPRLTSPNKFLPHFATLQAEGYEMVSGGGDVLVFQRIIQETWSATQGAAAINPIDMTGGPVTGNFASPTGFVNYETTQAAEAKASTVGQPEGAGRRRRRGNKLWYVVGGALGWHLGGVVLERSEQRRKMSLGGGGKA